MTAGKSYPSLIVAIDGPAGAGKTTISKLLSRKLGYRYIDTGALYRGIAVAVKEAGISPADDKALEALCSRINLAFQDSDQGLRLLLDMTDITDQVRTPQISMLASKVSARPVVRNFLLDIQRAMGAEKRVVVEGRDMGTVVFPDADVKFFLDADPKVRARRRHQELTGKAQSGPSLSAVEKDMAQRDCNDSTREVAPLKPAADAIRIDSTLMEIEQVIKIMLDCINKFVVA